jgi:methylated-DNA-[protein]-cysteine S-methyltransferase
VDVYEDMDSPVGRLRLIASDQALVGIWFEHGRDAARGAADLVSKSCDILARTRDQLEEYFAGTRREFDLPVEPRGTDFQRKVWRRLMKIPYGDTTTYGALAGDLGNRNGSRAVGLANGSNPIPIVIPCHRVIGADGSLTGFGGGLAIKAALLELERRAAQPRLL